MKILFLTRLFYPHIGGVEKHVSEVSKELIKKKYQIVVITEGESSNFQFSCLAGRRAIFNFQLNFNDQCQIKIYRIPTGEDNFLKKFPIWWWLWQNRHLIKEADIVHSHDVAFWYFPFRFIYPKKPFYITFHGWEGQFPIPLKNKIIRKISEKLSWGNICVGDFIKKWYGTKTSYVSYGGVVQNQKSKIKNKNDSSKVKITFIGRFERDTGLLAYLEAFRKIKINDSQFTIQFIGDGKLRAEAEKLGQVYGFVKDIRPCLLQSRFIFASSYLTILEALACQKLVFSVYDNPLKEDYLKMSPFRDFIVVSKNSHELSQKLFYYLHHPEEEKKLIQQGYNWAKQQSWEKVTQLYLRMYQKKKPYPYV